MAEIKKIEKAARAALTFSLLRLNALALLLLVAAADELSDP